MQNLEVYATVNPLAFKPNAGLSRILGSLASSLPANTAFDVELGGEQLRIGAGEVNFRVAIHNRRGVSALSSLDERRIGEAYLDGDITVQGDLVAAFDLRASLTDRHPLFRLWSIYGQRLLFGQVNRD